MGKEVYVSRATLARLVCDVFSTAPQNKVCLSITFLIKMERNKDGFLLLKKTVYILTVYSVGKKYVVKQI